jgi:tetratricopeptide (TPR) repeat protein
VAPTVLALLGLGVPDDLDGIDLCTPPDPAPRPVLVETIATMTLHGWAPLVGVRSDRHKYILAPTPELYELPRDPHELDNVHDGEPEAVRVLADRLGAWLGADPFLAARQAIDLGSLDADEEVRRHLAALGYVGTVRGPRDDTAPLHDPKDMVPHWEKLQHAINLRAGGRPAEALPIIEECVAEVEGDIFARSVLAAAYLQRGDVDRALETYERTIELEPNDESLHLGLATVHMARGELDEAERAVADALAVEPQCAEAYVVHGRIVARRRDEPQALAHFQRAIAMDPGGAGPSAHVEIGLLHLRARRLDDAREAFQAALAVDALHGGAHTGLANVLIEEGKLDEAARALAVALRFDPIQPGALASLGSLASRRGEHDRAIALCERALEIAPGYPQAHNNLGLAHRRLGDLDLAEAHYLQAIESGPFLDAPHVNLAQLYLRQAKDDEAAEQFRQALLVNPYCTIALANLGARHFNEGRADQAYAFYRRALDIDPDYALVHRNIASIYAQRDDPAQAIHHLQRSLELDPDQADADTLRSEIVQLRLEHDARSPAEAPKP